ncbi:MAG: hypothetical protein FJX74_21775 [Armatimonadetes bacterium]|nr:hypothetical protein [Armatimonadota bacterium]
MAQDAVAGLTIAPAPEGEALSEHYELTVNGVPTPVYVCRVSAQPFNQVWPGYQRPLDQTEPAGFATWDMAGPATVEVRSRRPVTSVAIRPLVAGIAPRIEGDRIRFELDRPRQLAVEVNGPHHALHLFACPPEADAPAADTPGVRYFGPGVHRPGRIVLESNQTVYLAPGAVVYGSLHADGAENIAVRGRGILDVSPFPRGEGGGAIRFSDCRNILIEGVVLRDPDVWCCSLFGCSNARIEGIKLVGLWRYNADGIDICNSQDVIVRDCFVRAFDDAIVLKGLKWGQNSFDGRPIRNVRVSGCTIWCDWGRALEIGAETCAPEIADVTFEDCDIIRTTHIAMDIQHGDRALVRNIRFEDIRVEMQPPNPHPQMQQNPEHRYSPPDDEGYLPALFVIIIRGNNYSQDDQRGNVRDVLLRNIALTAPRMPDSSIQGFDAEHTVDGVTFEGLTLNGEPVPDAAAARLHVGDHVANVRFAPSPPGD